MPVINRNGFCVFCCKFQNVEGHKNCYSCKECGTMHRLVLNKVDPNFYALVGIVKISNKKYYRKAVPFIGNTIDYLDSESAEKLIARRVRRREWQKMTKREMWLIDSKINNGQIKEIVKEE